MFLRSPTGRLFGLALLIPIAMLAAVSVLLSSTDRTRQDFQWVGEN